MPIDIQEDLARMLEAIVINTNYPAHVSSLNILLQWEFYFDICQLIFPEHTIGLVKIKENERYDAGSKLQHLIQILSQELQIDLSTIEGEQIVKGHLLHIHHFLQLLEKFSEIHEGNGPASDDSSSRRVKSDEPNTSERYQKDIPRSAREKRKKGRDEEEEQNSDSKSTNQSKKKKKKKKPTRPQSSNKLKRAESQPTNMYEQLVGIMMREKNRVMEASLRDNRKMKNYSIVEAKNKYKSYLINHAKQDRATKNREKIQSKSKKQYQELPIQDYDKIDNHFKSFSYKLRQAKYRYLKRLEKTIRDQQIDRMCYNNKLQREQKREAELKVSKQLERINNEHRVRNSVLKEQAEKDRMAEKIMKKEYSRYLQKQKKQLKQSKKQELKKIREFIDQENQKVLMNLEEGGPLERMIIDMYKRM